MSLEHARRYVLAYGLALVVALGLSVWRGRTFAIARASYWRARATRWKLALFAVAAGGMMVMAPRSGDPTWDWIDAGFMALLTYTTAPWTLGSFVRFRRTSWIELYVAACTWLFSSSWSYDLYIFVRDAGSLRVAWERGFYPLTWSSNLIASSLLYALGGACFSLSSPSPEHRGPPDLVTRLGVTLPFRHPDWPAERPAPLAKIGPIALVLVAIVVAMLGPFLWAALRSP